MGRRGGPARTGHEVAVTGRSTPVAFLAEAPWWFEWSVLRLVGVMLALLSATAPSDAYYYVAAWDDFPSSGWAGLLPEYPLPVAAALWPSWLLTRAGLSAPLAVLVPLLVVDLAFARTLARRGRRDAVRCWSWGVLLLGPVALLRLDLVAGVLLAGSLLATSAAGRGGLLALGTATKVFPVLALPAVAAGSRRPLAVLAWTTVAGGSMALVCVAVAGWGRLLSPLRYQADRGLQVESVLATPFHLARLVDPDRWTTSFAASRSWEISGPGTALAASASTWLLGVGLLAVAWSTATLWSALEPVRRGGLAPDPVLIQQAVTWVTASAVCTVIATSRVFSPQYLLWLLPVLAVVHLHGDERWSRWTTGLLAAALLTQVVYPHVYGDLAWGPAPGWLGVVVLTARNAIVVWLTLAAFGRAAGAGARLGSRTAAPAPGVRSG